MESSTLPSPGTGRAAMYTPALRNSSAAPGCEGTSRAIIPATSCLSRDSAARAASAGAGITLPSNTSTWVGPLRQRTRPWCRDAMASTARS